MRYDSASRRSFLLTFKTVAIGCSWSGVGLAFQKPLSQKHGSTFLPLQPVPALIFSVDWGLGRTKTKFQLYVAATMANLTLVAGQVRPMVDNGSDQPTQPQTVMHPPVAG